MLHQIDVLIALPNETDRPIEYIDRLYEAGIDDGILGVGRVGFIAVHVDREADTYDQALETLRADIRSAIPDVKSIAVVEGL